MHICVLNLWFMEECPIWNHGIKIYRKENKEGEPEVEQLDSVNQSFLCLFNKMCWMPVVLECEVHLCMFSNLILVTTLWSWKFIFYRWGNWALENLSIPNTTHLISFRFNLCSSGLRKLFFSYPFAYIILEFSKLI